MGIGSKASKGLAAGLAIALGSSSGGGGTTDYNNLSNKPKINNQPLSGNKTNADLGIATIIQAEEHQTVKTYVVPTLTKEQITNAYNGIVNGNKVIIVDDLDFINISVLDAASIDGISIYALFADKLLLHYNLDEHDNITVEGKEIGKDTEEAIPSGNTLPSGTKVNQWFYLLQDVAETTHTTYAGLYRFNGSLWELKAQKVEFVQTIDNTTRSERKAVSEKALAQYIASGNDGAPRTVDGIDLNTITATGFYFCNVCTNRPISSNGILIVSRYGGGNAYVMQQYFAFTDDKLFIRFRDNNTWKDWQQYYNKTEIDNLLQDKQNKTDNNLETDDKTIVGAINELRSMMASILALTNEEIQEIWKTGG